MKNLVFDRELAELKSKKVFSTNDMERSEALKWWFLILGIGIGMMLATIIFHVSQHNSGV